MSKKAFLSRLKQRSQDYQKKLFKMSSDHLELSSKYVLHLSFTQQKFLQNDNQNNLLVSRSWNAASQIKLHFKWSETRLTAFYEHVPHLKK